MQDELKKDMENLETIMIKLGKRQDIWQDRFIYWIAKAVYDVIHMMVLKKWI